jgi:hypothetical protein
MRAPAAAISQPRRNRRSTASTVSSLPVREPTPHQCNRMQVHSGHEQRPPPSGTLAGAFTMPRFLSLLLKNRFSCRTSS